MSDLREMGGEALRKEQRRVDKRLGSEINRLRLADAAFRAVLDRSLAIDDELQRRKNR